MKDTRKQNKKQIWLIISIFVLLAAVSITLTLYGMFRPQTSDTPAVGHTELYWNIDGASYTENSETGLTTREPGEDGLYHVRFVIDGQQVELTVINDRRLINYIDSMRIMGLVFDIDGIITDAVDPKTFATEAVKGHFVKKQLDGQLITNSSQAMNGMESTILITEDTGIYDVSSTAEVIGQISTCNQMDIVTVYTDTAGAATHVFITERATVADVYWRVERFYDSTKQQTTRVPDENGVYTMLFARNGEQVELKCREVKLVNKIDSGHQFYGEFALVFDDEGYIIDSVDVGIALRGKQACNNFNITEINGNTFCATRLLEGRNTGLDYNATFDESCDIFLVEDGCTAEFVGQRVTQLQLGDRITCYTDLDGKPILIFVVRRTVDSHMYYNLSRKFSNGQSTRTPDASGYYIFEMAANGGTVTVRTKSKDIANQIDSIGHQCMGLALHGDIIQKVYSADCICNWSSAYVGRYITAMSGTIVSASKHTDLGSSLNNLLAADCKIYDITGNYGVDKGSETTLQLNDRITAFKNISGELTHIFVTQRYEQDASIYYNIDRKYDSKKKETSRTPDENGYYIFEMICNGKQVTVKTKSKSLASYIDVQYSPIVALKVSGGIIKNAYTAVTAEQYGYKTANTHYVKTINSDGSFTTYYYSNGEKIDATVVQKQSKNCVIYNTSSGYISYRGEKTTLQVGDRIQAIADRTSGEVTQIFILSRKIDSPLYYHVSRKYNSSTEETTRTPDGNGYYVFDLVVDGTVKQYKTKDKTIASAVDAKSTPFALYTKGDIIIQVYGPALAKGIKDAVAGYFDVMSIDGNKAVVKRNRPEASNTGDSYEIEFAKNCKYIDVTTYSESFGSLTKLMVGDRVNCFINDDGKVVYCFIPNKNTHTAGHISYCAHCEKEVFWEPYTGTFYNADAHYYLTHDRSTGQKSVGSTDQTTRLDIVFDLNGHTLTSTGRAFLVYADLSIVDTAGNGKIVAKNNSGGNGGAFMVSGGGELNIYGGNITVAEDAGIAQSGGVLFIGGEASVVNMYGGTITGGKTQLHEGSKNEAALGGNIYLYNGTFNMYGGTISNGTAINGHGGNVYVVMGTFNMKGGNIQGGTAVNGGSIYLKGSSTVPDVLNMESGTIEGGTASPYGGNLYGTYADITIGGTVTGGNVISTQTDEKTTNASGANIYITNGTTVTVTGTVKDPVENCAVHGGNFRLANGQVVIDGGTVSGGTASDKGGNFYLSGTKVSLTVNSGTISGGKVPVEGGNIYSNSAAAIVTLNDGIITGGSAKNGGNVYFVNASVLNINGGMIANGTASTNGGNICSIWSAPVVRMAGGVVTGGSAKYGGNLYLQGKDTDNISVFEMSGGTVDGDVLAKGNTAITLSGDAIINMGAVTGLDLLSGIKITLGELSQTASIKIAASGVFTQSSEKAAQYVGCFTPISSICQIITKDNALWCEKDLHCDLKFTEGGTVAICPVCEKEVQWTALSGDTSLALANGGHYYLEDSITYAGSEEHFLRTESGTACLHLNGKDITATQARVIQGNGGSLNVIGTGTVSGNYNGSNNNSGATVYMDSSTDCAIRLYGGTYVKGTSSKPIMVASAAGDKASIQLYDGACIDSTGTTGDAVKTFYAGFIMHGGRIINSSANAVNIAVWNNTKVGSFVMHAGEITGNIRAAGRATKLAELTISGGIINGKVNVGANTDFTLSGAPTVTGAGLTITEGVRITLGELSQTASIKITATDIFTAENEKASDYVTCFSPAKDGDTIVVQDNMLRYVKGES